MSILIFLGVLFLLVLVHELGHFAVAKWTGMRVDEFGIGFPPKLFGVKRGETEYTLNALPIGGFVKIYGEDAVGVEKEQTEGAFTSKSMWAQSAVLVAGVTMNVLFAWLLVTVAFSVGVQSSVTESEASESAELVISNILEHSPAHEVAIPAGAIIESVQAGDDVLASLTPSSFTEFVNDHAGEVHTITYRKGDAIHVVTVTPAIGVIESAPERAALGVGLAQVDTVKRNIFIAMRDSGIYVLNGLRDITVGIFTLIVGKADFSQVAGPVGIVGLVGEASAYGLTTLLMFTAFISLNLAIINILPFPALDGGRLVLVGIEAIKGTPIKPQYVAVVNTIGFALLMVLMVVVTWNDIARLL
ncbi:MAG TPA: site-2 protease family protein [Candidatus Paceibacterota bacterium]|nr:site-2 protease family protein [Candidatus Paceibacterota bacterium]